MRFNRTRASGGLKRIIRGYRLGAALAVAAVLAAACSSPGTGASATGTAGGTTANNSGGSTINIGEIADLTGPLTYPGGVDGVKAAVAAVNKTGGIDHHALNFMLCDTQGNPNIATECANKMVSSHVLYVESDSVEGDSFMPVFKAAGIPVTTEGAAGTDAFTYPNSYILGSLALDGGAAAVCAKLGKTKIGIAQLDIAGIAPIVAPIFKAITPFGLSKANTSTTLIPPTAVDMSTYATALIQKSNCIVEALDPNHVVLLAAAIHSQNPSIPVVAPGDATVAQWKKIGKLAENVCDNAPVPSGLTAAPGMSQYNADMDTYENSGLRDTRSIAGWASVHLAAKLLANVTDPTAATYMHALNTAGTVDLPPLPPLTFSHPVSIVPGVTRYLSEDVVFFRHVDGGAEVPFYGGKYVNVMALKSEPPLPTAPHC